MERYTGVRGAARVKRITAALEAGGATVLAAPDPSVAPFEYRIRTAEGEVLDLVCYAFTANAYRQKGRPADEHRFQVKYGSAFDRAHNIYIDPRRRKLTLMFGVHDELDLFIAVDPAMHAVTWFSSSIELKERELKRAMRAGWHGWERERVAHGRRRVDPRESLRVETVLALRSSELMRYVQFERAATAMDPAERLLLIERLSGSGSSRPPPSSAAVARELEKQLGLSAREILEVIAGRGRLLTAVLGGVAELHLQRYLEREPDVTDVVRLDQDGAPDFTVRYRGRTKPVRLECKNVRRIKTARVPWVDFQKTRAAKGNPCSRYYAASQFEVLAACLHPMTERWDFKFRDTATLEKHKSCTGKLAVKVVVDGPSWSASLPEVLERLSGS